MQQQQQQQQLHMLEWMLLIHTSVLNEAQGQRQCRSQGVSAATVAGLQMYADKRPGRDLLAIAELDILPCTPTDERLELSS